MRRVLAVSFVVASTIFARAAPADAASMTFAWPVCGAKATGFGYRVDPLTARAVFHGGVDFVTDAGVAVRASANGRVIASKARGPYGNMVEIDHGHGYRTRYGHLQSLNVKPGDIVQRGQVIGAVGNTGQSTGPHLHFEIWFNDVVRDPMKMLEPDPACAQR